MEKLNLHSENYRDDLAKDLKEARLEISPDFAQDVLKKAQETEIYKNTKHYHQDAVRRKKIAEKIFSGTNIYGEEKHSKKDKEEYLSQMRLKEVYFSGIEKETLGKVIDLIISLRNNDILVLTDSFVKEAALKKMNLREDEAGYYIADDTRYSAGDGYIGEIIENGELARIYQTTLSPGEEGYFWTQYTIHKDETVSVDWETTDNISKAQVFEKITGHTEPFKVALDNVKELIENDKKAADKLMKEVGETAEEYGEIKSYKDFISRIDL